MPKFLVSSGDFEVVVRERSVRRAADLAVRLHAESLHPSSLGVLTLVTRLDRESRAAGDPSFIATEHLVSGFPYTVSP